MRVIPQDWLPAMPMKRIHGYWTAGNHVASPTDRKAYHLLVEGSGKVVRGVPSIAPNTAGNHDGCATSLDHYFEASDSELLSAAFSGIAESLQVVRLAR